MDTGRLLARQLRYCLRGAETEEQRQQVQWWLDKVAELAKQQPSAEPEQLEFVAPHGATGTEGGR